MLTQSQTRSVFKIASEIVNAKFARGGIISSKDIIGALLGAIVEDERLVKVCLCSEAGAVTAVDIISSISSSSPCRNIS
jgi:hypothetical protein